MNYDLDDLGVDVVMPSAYEEDYRADCEATRALAAITLHRHCKQWTRDALATIINDGATADDAADEVNSLGYQVIDKGMTWAQAADEVSWRGVPNVTRDTLERIATENAHTVYERNGIASVTFMDNSAILLENGNATVEEAPECNEYEEYC